MSVAPHPRSYRKVFRDLVYVTEPVPRRHLPDVREFIVSIVGEVTPLETMQALSDHNQSWLHAVRLGEQSGEYREYAGAFSILPLGREASQRFACNAMTGSQIALEHVVQGDEAPSSIYLGSIVSNKNLFNRAATLDAFNHVMGRMVQGRRVPMYTRPVSEDGLRTALKLGYQPTQNVPHGLSEMIYCRPAI